VATENSHENDEDRCFYNDMRCETEKIYLEIKKKRLTNLLITDIAK